MKKFLLMLGALSVLVACSDDDGKKKTCDCQKTIATYNAATETYEPVSKAFYSDDCDDDKPLFNPNGDGTYYNIVCTENK